MSFKRAIISVVIWTIGNVFFGLVQFFILVGGNLINAFPYTPLDIIKDGIIMFFCISVMGSVWIDYLIEKPYSNRMANFGINFFPVAALFLVSNLYTEIHGNTNKDYDFSVIAEWQNNVIVGAVAYCLLVKFAIFIKEYHHE